MRDKRAQFFLLAAVVCFALVPVGGDDYGALSLGVGVVYVVLAVLSALDRRSRG